MNNEWIPWHNDDIFHDDVAAYQLPDFFPVSFTRQRRESIVPEHEDLFQ